MLYLGHFLFFGVPFVLMLLLFSGLMACSNMQPSRDPSGHTQASTAQAQATRTTPVARQRPPQYETGTGFFPDQLAKADIDRVTDAYHQEIFSALRGLAEKLYRRNPAELRKSGLSDIKDAAAVATDPSRGWRFEEFGARYGTDAIQLAFREDYTGDRVRAFIAGLGGMMNSVFNGKEAFYMTDDLDPQGLYNGARNVEIAVWRLSNARMQDGRLYLLTNEAAHEGQAANLSFEREFGKIIGHLDLLARIVADKSSRTFVKIVQSLATAVFFPVVFVK